MRHEKMQQSILRRAKPDFSARCEHAMSRRVQLQQARGDDLVILRPGTTQHGLDASDEFTWRKRLRDVIVGAAFEAGHLVTFFRAGRQHDDGEIVVVFVPLAHARQLEPADVGQHPVHQRQVRLVVRELLARLASVGRFQRLESGPCQVKCNHFPNRRFVLDYEYSFCGHAGSNHHKPRI